ncbi:hypothetical protein AVEN_258737-1 [Araneus ventricosus]|uniref:Chloride channel CLIC-like protein 1 n=1 Tax=Araneus ventricosus TaxID=182803 RepID=A0A4Y2D1B5_ARAVE|nr:hypothetical protein AVEN_258737-1 [Araneus ventricosus]
MFYRNIFFFIFLCGFLLNSVRSDILQKNDDHTTEAHERIIKPTLQKPIDYKGRREIAEKYLNELAQVKEDWIDPNDMFGCLVPQRAKTPPEPKDEQIEHDALNNDLRVENQIEPNNELNEQTEVPQFSPPELDSDEKPTFSDIRGDIIDERIYIPDETTLNIDIEPGGSFTKGRQICVLDSIYISRWLKKLVLKIEKESNLVPSAMNFPIDPIMFNNLKELSTAKSLEISQLDELICKMIDQSSIIRIEDFDWTILSDYAKDLVWPITIFMVLTVCAYTVYQGILYRPLFTTLCCVCVSSVFWHWMHLYKQRQALKLAELSSMTVPAECRKHEFGLIEHFHEYLKSFFTSNECAKYYEALTVDPFWEVSITVAISEAVTSMLFQPLSVSSRYLNLAIRQLFDGLTIFMIIPLLIFLFLILIMLFNYRIRFPFFMGALEPHVPPVGSRVQELKSSKPVKALKDTVRCKLSSGGEGVCTQKSLVQGADVYMDTCDVPKKCRNQKYIQNFSEEGTHPELKDLPNEQLNLPSRIDSVLEQSASEDDISIIDSEENNTDTENSFMEQILPGCQQNCQCCFPVEYLSNTDCKACGDNLAMQSMDDSFHFSPEGNDLEDNIVK